MFYKQIFKKSRKVDIIPIELKKSIKSKTLLIAKARNVISFVKMVKLGTLAPQ